MYKAPHQLDLFNNQSLNPTFEIKRQLRLELSRCGLSRDEVVDRMNGIAVREGLRKSISKASLDGWTKDSDPDRLPSLPWLTIFCRVVDSAAPIAAMIHPLGCGVVDPDDQVLLTWARAEKEKRRAMKKAKLALEAIE